MDIGAVAACVLAVGAGAGAGGRGTGATRISGPSPFAQCATGAAFVNAEAEPAIASDPRQPKRLVAIYQQDRYRGGGGARGIVVALSENGGAGWRRLPLPVSSCAGPRARQVPFASDPWVSVGPDGRIYASTLSDVVSVTTSSDWGRSWSTPALVRGRGLTDKPTVTADPRRPGTAYVVWSDYRRTNPPGTESDELVSITHDGGRSWSAPKVALAHGTRAGPGDAQIVVDARSGRLYLLMAWLRDGAVTPEEPAWMLVAHSDDGGSTWSRALRFGIGHPGTLGGLDIRSSPQVPSFAIDGRGTLYAAWQDARFDGGAREDILLARSGDGGRRWTPVRPIEASNEAAIIPTIAARGNGVLGVLYLELADSGAAARYRVSTSIDGGRHFRDRAVSPRFAMTDAPDLTSSPLVPGGYFVGDYMGIAPVGGRGFATAFVVAKASDADRTDVFYAAVGRP